MLDYIKGTHKDAGIKYENYNDILITPLFKKSFVKSFVISEINIQINFIIGINQIKKEVKILHCILIY